MFFDSLFLYWANKEMEERGVVKMFLRIVTKHAL